MFSRLDTLGIALLFILALYCPVSAAGDGTSPEFTLKHEDIMSLAVSPDGSTIVSGSIGLSPSIVVWDRKTGKRSFELNGHQGRVTSLSIAPDNNILASISFDGALKFWDLRRRRLISTAAAKLELTVDTTFLPDMKRLLTGTCGEYIREWAVGDLKAAVPFETQAFRRVQPMASYAISKNGRNIAIATGLLFQPTQITIVDAIDGKVLKKMGSEKNQINSMVYSNDGNLLAVGYSYGKQGYNTIQLWDAKKGTMVGSLAHDHGVSSLAFTPDGMGLVSGNNIGQFFLWDVATQKQKLIVDGHDEQVFALHFTPDGKSLISGCLEGTIKIWNFNRLTAKIR